MTSCGGCCASEQTPDALDEFAERLSVRLAAIVREAIRELDDRRLQIISSNGATPNALAAEKLAGKTVTAQGRKVMALFGDEEPEDSDSAVSTRQVNLTITTKEATSLGKLMEVQSPDLNLTNSNAGTAEVAKVANWESEGFPSEAEMKEERMKEQLNKMRKSASVLNVELGDFSLPLQNPVGRSLSHEKIVTGDTIRVTEAIDIHAKFHQLDKNKTGLLQLDSLLTLNSEFNESGFEADEKNEQNLRKAVVKINSVLGEQHIGDSDQISLETFKVMMLASYEVLEERIGGDSARFIVKDLRQMMIHDNVATNVAGLCNVHRSDISSHQLRSDFVEVRVEPVVAIAILLNAILLGVSLDHNPDWDGWKVTEIFFTVFFIVEQVIKLRSHGPLEHYLGYDWMWNWFDTAIVACAIADAVITVLTFVSKTQQVDLSGFVVVRLIRLARIARLVRLLRLRAFKELSLMVNGVVGGMKTLFWAVVLLFILVYVLGLLMRQLMDPADYNYTCDAAVELGRATKDCNSGELTLVLHGNVMFGSVFRSMLTVFTCLVEGCENPRGTPLLWDLWDTRGPLLILCCVLVFIFVTFGIFNMILAIFVENTLEAARLHDQNRLAKKRQEQIRQAQKLQKLLVRFCTVDTSVEQEARGGLRKLISRRSQESSVSGVSGVVNPSENEMRMRVDRDTFETALETAEVRSLLEDLEVSITNADQLFNILDADGNGFLAIREIADGIMRLRGHADKGDTVAIVLMVRHLQKSVSEFEKAVLLNQAKMRNILKLMIGLPDEVLSPKTPADSFNAPDDSMMRYSTVSQVFDSSGSARSQRSQRSIPPRV